MQLTATTSTIPPATRPVPNREHGALSVGTVRAGGADVPAPANVVAQAVVELPFNFGAHARIDVSTGAVLGTYDSLEAAQAGARQLARDGRPTVGVVASGAEERVFRAVELLVPDFATLPFANPDGSDRPELPGWSSVHPTPLTLGLDAARGNRFIEDLWALDHRGADAQLLVEVATSAGPTITFEQTLDGRHGRVDFHQAGASS